jgi:hypothetical protein
MGEALTWEYLSGQLYPYCFDRCVIQNLIVMYTISLFYSDVLYWMFRFPRDGSNLALAALPNVARGHPISTYSLMSLIESTLCKHSPPTLMRRHDPSMCLERQIRLEGTLCRKFSATAITSELSFIPASAPPMTLRQGSITTIDTDCIVQGVDVVVAMLGVAVVQRTNKIKRTRSSERGSDSQHHYDEAIVA